MKLVKIYGERNTNTNYLGELMSLNLDVAEIPEVVPKAMRRIQTKLPAKKSLRDIYFQLTYNRNLGWKHAKVENPQRIKKCPLLRNNEVHFITLTKNPYSWLLSLFRRPCHQLQVLNALNLTTESIFNDAAITIINRHLDKNAMGHFGYEYLNGEHKC